MARASINGVFVDYLEKLERENRIDSIGKEILKEYRAALVMVEKAGVCPNKADVPATAALHVSWSRAENG